MYNRYILFFKPYYSINRQYRLLSYVKYNVKHEDDGYYYTIKDIRIPKNLENKNYIVQSFRSWVN